MSLDRSLKTKGSLARHRNVLTRAERILRLQEEERWHEGERPFGLPKLSNRKAKVGGKTKKAAEETAAPAEGAPADATTTEPKKTEAKKPEAKKTEAKK